MNLEHLQPYARLLSAVIVLAVQDAGAKPTKEEQRTESNRLADTVSAFEYLFGVDRDVFETHAHVLGADPDQIREALLSPDRGMILRGASVSPERLRTLRIRHRWFQKTREAA